MEKRLFLLLTAIFFTACGREYISKKREGLSWFSQQNESREAQEEKRKD